MKLVELAVLVGIATAITGCAGTFSGSKNAYLKDSGSSPQTKDIPGVQLKQEKQYLPSADELASPDYQAPSMVPPGQQFSSNDQVMFIGMQNTALAINSSLPVVWKQVALALKKTDYTIMDQDQTLHSYFIIDKVKTGGSIQRESPIYQLGLSSVGVKTEIHLFDSKNEEVNSVVANRIMRSIEEHYI